MLFLQVLTVTLVAAAMAMSLAHALEMPGKMRLGQQVYAAVQAIYYPGFTIGGAVGEVGGTIATAILLFVTPSQQASFWLTFVALMGLVGMQAVYWFVTHPINRFWVEGETLGRFGSGFFSFGLRESPHGEGESTQWLRLRKRWEYSHVSRAVLAFISFVALVVAIAL